MLDCPPAAPACSRHSVRICSIAAQAISSVSLTFLSALRFHTAEEPAPQIAASSPWPNRLSSCELTITITLAAA